MLFGQCGKAIAIFLYWMKLLGYDLNSQVEERFCFWESLLNGEISIQGLILKLCKPFC